MAGGRAEADGRPEAAASPAEARRALLAQVRRRPGWPLASTAALVAAGLAAIPQARLLAGALSGAFLERRSLTELSVPLAWLLAVVVFRAVAEGLGAFAGRRAASAIARGLRSELTGRLQAMGPAYLERRRTGVLGAEVIEGVDRVGPMVARFLPQAVVAGAVPLAIALYVLTLDPLSGLLLLVTGPLIPFFMWLLGSLAEDRAQRQWRNLGLLSARALDAFQGMETLRLFGRERNHEQALADVGERYRRTTMDVLRLAFLSGFALELLAMLGIAMVAVSVGLRLANGDIGLLVALTALLLAPEFFLPLRRLGAQHHAGMEGTAAMRDLASHLGRPLPTFDASPATSSAVRREPPMLAATPEAREPVPAVELARVWAGYPGRAQPALRGIELALPATGVTALVGRSGAGKSSVARLLIGTLKAQRGAVLVGGRAIDPATDAGWRAHLAYVPQQPHLFEGTVLENLRLARPGASVELVEAAARAAEADGFIRSLPQGYRTVLGEDALDLAGGERQRLAIARAFLRDAELVILDEISAYLDPATEAALNRAVVRLAEHSAVLVIAHRLATVRRASQVALLDEGRVIEQGSHRVLAASGGAYARLAMSAGARPLRPGAA